MSNIRNAFKNGKAVIPFITCGDPDLATTGTIIRAMADAGADLIELGIPFSDPTAEGPVVQSASIRALAGGVTTDKIFDFVRELRRDVTVPLIVMTYANVVISYGIERFVSKCAEVGIDGVILPDVPMEEKDEFVPICRSHGVDFISQIAPTSANRIAEIAKDAEGFIYIASNAILGNQTDLDELTAEIRRYTDIPCAIECGDSNLDQTALAQAADGVILNSAIVEQIGRYGRDAAAPAGDFVQAMKRTMNK